MTQTKTDTKDWSEEQCNRWLAEEPCPQTWEPSMHAGAVPIPELNKLHPHPAYCACEGTGLAISWASEECPCLRRLAGEEGLIACLQWTAVPWSGTESWPGCSEVHQPDCKACNGSGRRSKAAGFVGPSGGAIAAGSNANEDSFIAALDATQ